MNASKRNPTSDRFAPLLGRSWEAVRLEELKVTRDEALPNEEEHEAPASEVEVLEIEDDLDTGMHRINVCQPGF
jgi:hypothetical protein